MVVEEEKTALSAGPVPIFSILIVEINFCNHAEHCNVRRNVAYLWLFVGHCHSLEM
jgi:hypothetical protein